MDQSLRDSRAPINLRESSGHHQIHARATNRDRERITIAVTPIKIEMISSGITQPISIQFSVIRNQREGEREDESKNTCAYQEYGRKQKTETARFQH